jgi:phosphoenolpyruvate synthase/pyruvate phosphate dikinase
MSWKIVDSSSSWVSASSPSRAATSALTRSSPGLFVRSSTNAEDLPGFSGAGLYTTVPNVKGDEALLTAVKTVWASIWNDGAYAARQEAGMSHFVYPGVLVQLGMNADAAGVLVTTNPFNKADRSAVYVNAKRGLGIRVVDGHKVPEQIVYNPARDRVRVITRSADDTALTFSADGGVREVTVETGRAVLSDGLVRRLARAAAEIERRFKIGALDIEWLTIGETIYIVQVRPYQE